MIMPRPLLFANASGRFCLSTPDHDHDYLIPLFSLPYAAMAKYTCTYTENLLYWATALLSKRTSRDRLLEAWQGCPSSSMCSLLVPGGFVESEVQTPPCNVAVKPKNVLCFRVTQFKLISCLYYDSDHL